MYPPPPIPQPYFVALLDLLGYASHLYDGDRHRGPRGLESLYETYFLLLHALQSETNLAWLELDPNGDGRIVPISEVVSHQVFSDTILLWAPPDKARFLVVSICRLMLHALARGAPLRGALAFGDCILDEPKGILLGYPMVDAARAERSQDWVGVGVLPEAAACLSGHPAIVAYPVPMKATASGQTLRLEHAVAWHYAEETPFAAATYLERLASVAPSDAAAKYQNAIAFVRAVLVP